MFGQGAISLQYFRCLDMVLYPHKIADVWTWCYFHNIFDVWTWGLVVQTDLGRFIFSKIGRILHVKAYLWL